MLSKEELVEFLALLLAFTSATRLSAVNASVVLRTSVATMSRWMAAARAAHRKEPTNSTYHHIARPVADAIKQLNSLNEARGVYEAVSDLPARDRVAALRSILDGKNLW
jgi:hypothetical protein